MKSDNLGWILKQKSGGLVDELVNSKESVKLSYSITPILIS